MEEQTLVSEINADSWKKSCAGYLGRLGRCYKELEELLGDTSNYGAVLKKYGELENIFQTYNAKFDSYIGMLTEEEAKTAANEQFNKAKVNKQELDERVHEWIAVAAVKMKETLANEVGIETRSVKSLGGQSERSSSSTSSVRVKEAKARRVLANLKREKLRKAQLLKEEQLKLEQRQAELELEAEIACADAEIEIWQEEQQQPAPNVEVGKDERVNKVCFDKDKQTVPTPSLNPNSAALEGPQREASKKVKDDNLKMTDFIEAMNMSVNMPKPELQVFDGNPINYWKFISSFDVNVASKLSDDRARLTYLLQYCNDAVKDVISCCVLMPPKDGYNEARLMLQRQYGQAHVVTHALINDMLDRSQIKANDENALLDLSRKMRRCEITLRQMGHAAELNASDNLLKIQRLLPMYIQTEWAKRAQHKILGGEVPNFNHLTELVEEKAQIASSIYGRNLHPPAKDNKSFPKFNRSGKENRVTTLNTAANVSQSAQKRSWKCLCCPQQHDLASCEQFKAKTRKERFRIVRKARLCDNCFKPRHVAGDCRSPPGCQASGCNMRHHTLLHIPRENTGAGAEGESPTQPDDQGASGVSLSTTANVKVGLRVLPVKVKGKNKEVTTLAILDQGSNTSLLTKKLSKELGLEGESRSFTLSTVNDRGEGKVSRGIQVELTIKGIDGPGETMEMSNVWTIERLPVTERSIPEQTDINQWPHLKGIKVPNMEGLSVNLLIGSDTPEAFWVLEERRGRSKEPYAVRTPLGWTVLGPLSTTRSGENRFVVNHVIADNLEEQVSKFWEIDYGLSNYFDERVGDSLDDIRARTIMENSVVRENGHYTIAMPWRSPPSVPNNKSMALARLQGLKRRLNRNPDLKRKYEAVVEENIKRGYAQEVDTSRDEGKIGRIWYLPHQAVINPKKPEKVRVVYDCAATFLGTSLNQQLLQGPDNTNSLLGVLTRFRQEQIALVADIEGMFNQVRVTSSDADMLRFLWWKDGDTSKEVTEYQMLVHLFGAKSSPSCAGFALRKVAEDDGGKYEPDVSQTIRENFYVDDCLKSVESRKRAKEMISQLTELLGRGGFHLTKWMSNDREVLAGIHPSERAPRTKALDLDSLPIERTLGVLWDMERDEFTINVSLGKVIETRRGILSAVSSLYDPLGFVAPFTMEGKFILQTLCAQRLGWDSPIGNEELQRWRKWLSELPDLENVVINRCFKPKSFKDVTYDLHVFGDASEKGYSACAYLRASTPKGEVHCSFVLGKARLCPLKKMTIPRLELTAAVLAVKVGQVLKEELTVEIRSVTYWTDSTSVLLYIANQSRRFKTFVANRVAKIRESSDLAQWRYVDSNSNPADDGSRGVHAVDLTTDCRWLKGPAFLWEEERSWPKSPLESIDGPVELDMEEVREECKQVFQVSENTASTSNLLERYSTWSKLKVGVAWLLRFMHWLKAKAKGLKYERGKTLELEDFRKSEEAIVRCTQRLAFAKEIQLLNKGSQNVLRKQNAFKKLCPMVVAGILRVGGRLERAPISVEQKHPIILPSDHHVTRLIVEWHHQLVGHSGMGMTWASIRRKFWILKGGATVRRVIGKCINCRRRNAPRGEQIMGELPHERVTPNKHPFSFVGLDYFGPLMVKQGRSQVKKWGCLFTCLTMRAVHIELADSLDTDSFLNAFRRFTSRRGMPEKVFSDNGTNFMSGEKELRLAMRELDSDGIRRSLCHKGVEWHFNPPTASHMGGAWERIIRSVRRILKALLREQLVNQEVLHTVMTEVEQILNSRPITPISLDPRDAEPLTPNHLLLLRANSGGPPGYFVRADGYGRKRWRQSQYIADQFWKRWIKEYLPLLQKQQKWHKEQRNFQVNDIVLLVDDRVPRGQWSVGRVVKAFPDRKGRVRQVEVRVGARYLKRPIVKLCLLEGCGTQ